MSRLLIDDYPIQVLPKLAKEVGLNEAIFLQQLHYWLNGKNAKEEAGRRWIYNTYEDWQKQFPFWSVITIKRTVSSLSKQKLIIKDNFNKAGFDKTIWYSIDYTTLKGMSRREYQNDTTRVSKRYDGEYQNEPTNTIDYTETTTETNKEKGRKFTDAHLRLATKLHNNLKNDFPKEMKKVDLEKWADIIRLMQERDELTIEQIEYVIDWLPKSDFWFGNIRSAKKLREQFDKLRYEIKSEKNRGYRKKGTPPPKPKNNDVYF